MKNKTYSRNWDDVKMVLTTGAITLTLFFWNLFSKLDGQADIAQVTQVIDTPLPPTAIPTQVVKMNTPIVLPTNPLPTSTAVPQVIVTQAMPNEKSAAKVKVSKPKASGRTGSSR